MKTSLLDQNLDDLDFVGVISFFHQHIKIVLLDAIEFLSWTWFLGQVWQLHVLDVWSPARLCGHVTVESLHNLPRYLSDLRRTCFYCPILEIFFRTTLMIELKQVLEILNTFLCRHPFVVYMMTELADQKLELYLLLKACILLTLTSRWYVLNSCDLHAFQFKILDDFDQCLIIFRLVDVPDHVDQSQDPVSV